MGGGVSKLRSCVTVHRRPLFSAHALCLSKVDAKKSEIEEESTRTRADARQPFVGRRLELGAGTAEG